MKPLFILTAAAFILLFSGCASPTPPKPPAPAATNITTGDGETESDEGEYLENLSKEDLGHPETVYALAHEAQENGFPEFEKEAPYFIVYGHFTSDTTEEALIVVSAHAGVSCGSCCNLYLLYNCRTPLRLIRSGNIGDLAEENVSDLDNDGLLEVAHSCGYTWSCELGDRFSIINFAGGKENLLYESSSANYMVEACGDMYRTYKNGDTLSTFYEDSLIDPDGDRVYQVLHIRETNFYRGGKTESEMIRLQRTMRDTSILPLERKEE